MHVVRFSRDGNRLFSASGWPGRDHGIRIGGDLTTQTELFHIPRPGNVNGLDLTPDDRLALVGLSNGLILSVDLSPDGRQMVTGSVDGMVRRWDFQTGDLLRNLSDHKGFVWSVAFSPDGQLAASGGGGERRDGNVVAGTDFDIRLWDLAALPVEATQVLKYASRGWLGAASILFFLIAVFCVGVWFLQRQRSLRGTSSVDPEAVILPCSGCGQNLRAKTGLIGKKVKCPQCGEVMRVPTSPNP